MVGRLQAPELPTLSATSHWVSFSNPMQGLASDKFKEIDQLLKKLEGATETNALLFYAKNISKVRLASITFSNNGNIRSKDIEVSGREGDGFFFWSDAAQGTKLFSPTIKLKPLAPGQSVEVLSLDFVSYRFLPSRFLALHEGRRIDVTSSMVPDEFHWLVWVLSEYPFVGFITLAMGAMALILFIILVPLGVATDYSPEFKLRMTHRRELEKLVKFIEWVRLHHPDKLPPEPRPELG